MLHKITTKLTVFILFALLLLPAQMSEAFTDTQGHYNEDAIDYLYEKGVVEGYGDGSYAPEGTINRAEFVKILIESKYPSQEYGVNCFSDVGTDWYAPYVCYAEDLGIIDGYGDGYFRPANEINLAEALKVVLETYEIDVCNSCYSVWYEAYTSEAEDLDLLDSVSQSPSHEVTRGEMAQLVYNVEMYLELDTEPEPVTKVPVVSIPDSSDCSEGHILDENDDDDVPSICKPGLIDLNTPDDLDYYLADEIYGTEIIWNDWKDYKAIQDVLDDILDDSMNDMEKAETIANWVHISKNYGSGDYEASPANDNASFEEIFTSDEGICYDGATVTTAMLRVAGIPAISKMISYDHILNLFYYNGYWYSTDTTFCYDKTDCNEVTIYDEDFIQNEYYTLYSRAGHYENEDGEYCDGELCLDGPFVTNKMMPINNSSDAQIIFPSLSITPNTDDGSQISCYLQETTGSEDEDDWDYLDLRFQYEINRTVGYNQVSVPTVGRYESEIHYRYVCAESLSGDLVGKYEFSLEEGDSMAVTYEDLEKVSGADSDDFNRVVDYLRDTTEGLGIEIIYE